MAAVTVANRTDSVFGNRKIVFADLSSVDNNDTWATGLQDIDICIITPTAAAATTQMGATTSGGTVTFKCESGSLACAAMVVGT